jgi:threonine dehydrogenase-like Zn-dependent dehydrogenase
VGPGAAPPLYWALELVRHFGQVGIIGERQESKINPSNHFLRKEVTLSGSTCFPLQEFDEIARMYERGLRAAEMITHRFTVDQAAEAYATFATRQTGKCIFVPKKQV